VPLGIGIAAPRAVVRRAVQVRAMKDFILKVIWDKVVDRTLEDACSVE
jgi:hypothetical protein